MSDVRLAHPQPPVEGKQVLAPKNVLARPPLSYVVVVIRFFYTRQKDDSVHTWWTSDWLDFSV